MCIRDRGIADGDNVAFVAAGDECSAAVASGVVESSSVTVVLSGVSETMEGCYAFQQSSVGMVKQPVTQSLHEETETVVVTLEPQALMAFVNVEQRLSFPTLNTNDKIAWTEESDCMALVMDPVRVNNNKEAIVEFNKGANQLMLCVCTNGVDYDLMENVTMAVVEVSVCPSVRWSWVSRRR